MTAPALSVSFSFPVAGSSGAIAVGNFVVPVNGTYVVATAANRALGGRAHGIVLSAWGTAVDGAIGVQQVGAVSSTVTGLAAGTASWVRVSSTGVCERCTPSGSDDIVGYCWTDGTLLMLCGQWTAAIVNGGGGSTSAAAISALNVDWSAASVFTKTLSAGGNTFTFSNAASGMVIIVRLTGAASTVTWPTVKWAGGTPPTQTASGTDVYTFVHDGTSIYGSVLQAMA